MLKFATFSIALAILLMPLATVRQKGARQAWARAIIYFGLFTTAYVLSIIIVLPRIGF